MNRERLALAVGMSCLLALVASGGFGPPVSSTAKNIGNLGLVRAMRPTGQPVERDRALNGALSWFDVAADYGPGIGDTPKGRGLALRERGDFEGAEIALAEYLANRPSDSSARLELGDIAYQLGKVDLAYWWWRQVPGERGFISRATQHVAQGKLELARLELEVAEASVSTHDGSGALSLELAHGYASLARAYRSALRLEEHSEACDAGKSAYELALRRIPSGHPSEGPARIYYGIALRECGKLAESVAQLQMIGSGYSSGQQAWASAELGTTYLIANDLEAALAHLERAVALDPDHGGHRIMLGHLYARMGWKEDALRQYQIVLETSDARWRAWAESEVRALELENEAAP